MELRSGHRSDKDDESPVTIADYGAQALVAWSLARSLGGAVSLVAEEDAVELRKPAGEAMLASIAHYVNAALAGEHPEVRAGGAGGPRAVVRRCCLCVWV